MHDDLQRLAAPSVALEAVTDALVALNSTARHYHKPPSAYGAQFMHSWGIEVVFSDCRRELIILVDADFPYSLPRIAVKPEPTLLSWPHLEAGGLLCLFGNSVSWDPRQPGALIQRSLGEACLLIEDNIVGHRNSDYRDEFLSYWARVVENSDFPDVCLVTPSPPSRSVVVWRSTHHWIFADDKASLRRWLEYAGVKSRKMITALSPAR